MSRQRRPYMAKMPIEKAVAPDCKHAAKSVDCSTSATSATSHKQGRPTIFSQEIAEEICERLSSPESMRSICNDAHMPARSTIAAWMATNDVFRAMIAHARELQAEAFADQCIAIADDKTGDVVVKDGKVIQDWESVQRAKLRVDARKWYAAKLAPKKFSERMTIEEPVDRPMMPKEVEAALADLLSDAERHLGIKPLSDASVADRFTAIINSGQPVPPALYRAMHSAKASEHGYN